MHITIVFGFMLLVTIIFYCLVYRKVNSLQERYRVQEQQDRVGYQAKKEDEELSVELHKSLML